MRRLLVERDGSEVEEHAGGFGTPQRPPAQDSHVQSLGIIRYDDMEVHPLYGVDNWDLDMYIYAHTKFF